MEALGLVDFLGGRAHLGMSQTEMAKEIGVSTMTVNRLEEGEGISLSTAHKVVEFWGLDLGDVVNLNPRSSSEPAAA